SAWSGDSGGVQHVRLKLPGMAGSRIVLRVYFTQDSSLTCAAVRPGHTCGVLVDNVAVRSVIATPQPGNVDKLLTFVPAPSSFKTVTDTTGCPAGFVGKFSFDATLTSLAGNPPLSNLMLKVLTLTNGNLLQNADGGPAGVGGVLSVPKTGSFADGIL